MPRKPTKAEVESVVRRLGNDSDTLFEITQMKAAIRLVKDDDYVDKDLREYIDQSLSLKLNDIFRGAVQSRTDRKLFTVADMLSTVDDELFRRLKTLTSHEVPIFIFSSEKTKLLLYDAIYNPTDAGYEIDSRFTSHTQTLISFEKDKDTENEEYNVFCPTHGIVVAYWTKKRPLHSIGLKCGQCNYSPIKIESKFKALPLPEVYDETIPTAPAQ